MAAPDHPPRVSILLPARDASATLDACLRSVLRQRFGDWECLVVDDGSQDRTAAIADDWAARDPRFVILRREPRGLVATLNAGLARCRGEFVARMDADDLMHRERLAEQVRRLDECPDLDGVGCHVRLFPRAAIGPGYREYERWLNSIRTVDDVRRELFVECPLAHPTWTMRREWLQTLGYRDVGWPEDYDLLLRASTSGRKFGIVPRRRLAWRRLPTGASRGPGYSAERFTCLKAHFLAHSLLGRSNDYILWGYGGTGRALRRELERLGKRPTHIVELHPGRLGQRIHGALVVEMNELTRLVRQPVVVSVANTEARTAIRSHLDGLGLVETVDYVCAA